MQELPMLPFILCITNITIYIVLRIPEILNEGRSVLVAVRNWAAIWSHLCILLWRAAKPGMHLLISQPAATLPISPPQHHLRKEITADSWGLFCLPSQLCKPCRNPTMNNVLILFQYPFSQPRAGKQTNPSPDGFAKPQKSFVMLPTVLPAAQQFSFEGLHQNPSLDGFSALSKGLSLS